MDKDLVSGENQNVQFFKMDKFENLEEEVVDVVLFDNKSDRERFNIENKY